MIEVSTEAYERKHGHAPKGRDCWTFKLISRSVTHRDHVLTTDLQSCDKALQRAQELAGVRRAIQIVVMPLAVPKDILAHAYAQVPLQEANKPKWPLGWERPGRTPTTGQMACFT
jgi:hypothetical protein